MNCPACSTHLTCPCPTCLCDPRFAGTRRWIRDGAYIVCPVCDFRAHNLFWCASQAMDALILTDDALEPEAQP